MIIAFDCESELIRPGCLAPRMVCIQWQSPGQDPQLMHANDQMAHPMVKRWLLEHDILVGHNVAFDMSLICAKWPDLIPLVFDKYDRSEITDTMLRQALIDIESGTYRGYVNQHGIWKTYRYSLDALSRRLCRRALQKDVWRLRYMDFMDIPLSEWPDGARQYPLEDARATLDCYLRQPTRVEDEFRQARYAFAAHLTSCWGVKTHPDKVRELASRIRQERDSLLPDLLEARFVRSSGKKNTKVIAEYLRKVCNGKPRLTDKGNVAINADACRDHEDPLLQTYAKWSELGTILNKDIPMLLKGSLHPIQTRFSLADTGRVRSSAPNCQNLGRSQGVRECIVPRPGCVLAIADYEMLELRAFAQVCMVVVGRSKMAEALNAGKDPHLMVAATILGKTYEWCLENKKSEEVDLARQAGKIANFGLVANAKPETLAAFAKSTYGVKISEADATMIKENWLRTWPEARYYFRYIDTLQRGMSRTFTMQTLYSKRKSVNLTYTQCANRFMQACGADAARLAWYLVVRACYSQQESPLFGCRVVMQVHDEFVLECPVERASAAAMELERLMCLGANKLFTHVPAKAPALLAWYYSKKAKALYDEKGGLVPWPANDA